MIIGWGENRMGVRRNDLFEVLFPEGRAVFAHHLLEVVNESR